MPRVQFAEFTPEERIVVEAILDRAKTLSKRWGWSGFDRQGLEMDISVVRAKYPLDLPRLAQTADFSFAHDVRGIVENLDRRTGILLRNWLPRHLKSPSAEGSA